jgi:rod shape-determining protein MreC
MKKIGVRRYFISLVFIGLFVLLYFIGFLSPIENAISSVLNPFIRMVHNFSSDIKASYSEHTDNRDLAKVVEDLEFEVGELTKENTELKIMAEENKILREYLNFFTDNEQEFVMGNVIAKGGIADVSGRTETLTIDKGQNSGIREGYAVINSQGAIIGKVAEVKEKISKIYLTNSERCNLAATGLGESKTNGIAKGELGLTIKMEFIPQTSIIKEGDIIITSGLEEYIPRGLVIGKVISVKNESNELWQTAMIEPISDPDNIVVAAVILPELVGK